MALYLTERGSTPVSAKGRSAGRIAVTVFLMGTVSMVTDISSESVSAILPLYLTVIVGLGPLAYGFIDGIYQGVSALVRILGGWVADRSDHPKWVAVFGYGISAITRVALIPFTSFGAITTIITVDRLGKGIRTGPRDAIITASSKPENLGRSFGVHRAMDTLGAVIGPLLAFAVLQAVSGESRTTEDFHSIFVISFAAAVIGVAILLLIVRDIHPRRESQTPLPSKAAGPSLALLRDRRFALLLVAATVLGFLTVGDGFVYLALQQRDDVAIDYFPLLYVGTNIAYFVLAVPFGWLADRWGRGRMFLLGHVALPLAYLAAGGWMSGRGIVLLTLFLMGVYYAATDGVLAALAGRIAPAYARSSSISTAQTVQAVARFASSLAFGLLWTLFGARTALLANGVVLALILPVAWVLLRRAQSRPRQPVLA